MRHNIAPVQPTPVAAFPALVTPAAFGASTRFEPAATRAVKADTTANLMLQTIASKLDGQALQGLRRVELRRGQCLSSYSDTVLFPETGIFSVALPSAETSVSVGLVGREGMFGLSTIYEADGHPYFLDLASADATAVALPASRMRVLMRDQPEIRTAMLRYAHVLFVQSAAAVGAALHQRIEARIARVLLMWHDRIEGDDLMLTHASLAKLVGAERSSVTLALHMLEGCGSIRSKRGLIVIRDRQALTACANGSYGQAEGEYRKLVGPFGRTQEAA